MTLDDQPRCGEPVDQPGQAAAAEQQPLGQRSPSAASVPGALGELQQDLVGAEREAVLALELLSRAAIDRGCGSAAARAMRRARARRAELVGGDNVSGIVLDGTQRSLLSATN